MTVKQKRLSPVECACVCIYIYISVCVCEQEVIEINGVRSEEAIRTMEGSKEGGEKGSRRWSARHPLSRL